jgi:pimeloyl-ACP methyl ester carboxylesterase
MFRYVATILVAILLSAPLVAGITPFPPIFHTQMVPTNGTSLYVRVGSKGPAVVLLHGFGFTGDMWAPLAIVLAKDHTVIVPDLRGMGMSDHPDTGYTKKNQAVDIAGVMDALKVQTADLVTHDIGNMVGYASAAQCPVRVTRWVVIDAPLPGIGDWDNITRSPMLWHFNFRGPDEERLVQGRERIYLDRFWNELSGDPKGIDEDTRQHYAALYARLDIAAQLEIHAKQELDRALIISRQIDYLGKMPAVTPKPVRTSTDAKEMLRFDLENENDTIRNYRDRIRQCETLGEFAMAEQIRQILVQEQDHQIDLATALGEEVPDLSGSPQGRTLGKCR